MSVVLSNRHVLSTNFVHCYSLEAIYLHLSGLFSTYAHCVLDIEIEIFSQHLTFKLAVQIFYLALSSVAS